MPRRVRYCSLLALILAAPLSSGGCSEDGPGPRGPKHKLPVSNSEPGTKDPPARRDGSGPAIAEADARRKKAEVKRVGQGRVTCPAGTEHQGAPPPHGKMSFCLRRTDDGGVRHGPFRQWSDDGTVLNDGTYENGERDGQWLEYYADGTPKALTTYSVGVRDGEWKTWFENGKLSGEGSYADGRKDGKATFYYDDGTPKAEGMWKNDVKVGKSTNWHPDGSLMSEGEYIDGNKTGAWVDVDASGNRTESTWDNGTKVEG